MRKYQTDRLVGYDVECYPNFFVVGFITPEGYITQFTDPAQLASAVQNIRAAGYELCGFNSNDYDDLVLSHYIQSKGDCYSTYELSCKIINDQTNPWDHPSIGSVDIMPLLPGRMSLKQVGVRMRHERLQELPINPHQNLNQEEANIIIDYNKNDLYITAKLIGELSQELAMRSDLSYRYDVDLRSKGDASIAEVVLSQEVGKLTGKSKKQMKNEARSKIVPDAFITVKHPSWWDEFDYIGKDGTWLKYILSNQGKRFNVPIPLDHNGRMVKGSLSDLIYMNDSYYQTGVGGLHSVDGSGCVVATGDQFLVDIDVASYYPRIALTQKFFPWHLGEAYGKVYEEIVDMRLAAKKAKNMVVANGLKITINGAFGKSSDPFSALYDPSVTAGITVVGQVALLILIAMLADNGINTLSANTDGITATGPIDKLELMKSIVKKWEEITSFDMEYTHYQSTWQLDVNNYMAIKADGKIKAKGAFTTPDEGKYDLRHSVNFNIVAEAVKSSITTGVDVGDYIRACTDIHKFAITQAVTGQWKTEWKGMELGKLVRFYKSMDPLSDSIIRIPPPGAKGNQGIVANSENCIPIQDLPDQFPSDVDYEWYIDKAESWMSRIMRPKGSSMNALGWSLSNMGLTPALVSSDPAARSSRAYIAPGELDWNALEPGTEMGISTGKKAGVIAVVDNETKQAVHLYRFDGNLPSKTREKVNKEHGQSIIYGANVRLGGKWDGSRVVNIMTEELLHLWKDNLYTESELKKVGA